jgi:uncharacterized protein
MRFNVSGLVQEGIGATREYPIDDVITGDKAEPERVTGKVEFIRTKAGVLVRAHLRSNEPEACSRCLRPVEETVQIDFEEEFQITIDPRTGVEVAEAQDPDVFKIDPNHTLDLTEAVRQYREVSLMMKPLCRPDCRGLCPICGADLNEGDCDCEGMPVDVRLAGLAALKSAVFERKE